MTAKTGCEECDDEVVPISSHQAYLLDLHRGLHDFGRAAAVPLIDLVDRATAAMMEFSAAVDRQTRRTPKYEVGSSYRSPETPGSKPEGASYAEDPDLGHRRN